MTSVSAGHIIQTPTQPVGSGRPQRESNPGPPHQESRALPQSYRAPRKREKEREREKEIEGEKEREKERETEREREREGEREREREREREERERERERGRERQIERERKLKHSPGLADFPLLAVCSQLFRFRFVVPPAADTSPESR